MAAIEALGLRKTYSDKSTGQNKTALENLDLTIEEGAFFGLLGPNGAGKSTFINIIAGLTLKTSGKIRIFGHDLDTELEKAKFLTGIVPQELTIDPFFTVRETLENYAGYFGVAKPRRHTNEILEILGLSDKADAKPRNLSGGMRRRLLVAKALVHSPKLLILDEPTAGVDIELRNQLWDYVGRLNNEGTTIILTTHYLQEAEELCKNIAIINKGRLIACDKTETLIRKVGFKKVIFTLSQKLYVMPDFLLKFGVYLENENKLVVKFQDNNSNILDNILKGLIEHGIKINDIVSHQADLEEAFKSLID